MTPGSTCEDLALSFCFGPPRLSALRLAGGSEAGMTCPLPWPVLLLIQDIWFVREARVGGHPRILSSTPQDLGGGWWGSCLCRGINQTLPHPWKLRKDPVLPSSCGQSSGRALSRSLGVRLWLGPPLISLRLSFRFREAEIRKPALTQRC